MATILKPDSTISMGGVTVNYYPLTVHNPNKIAMPSASMAGKIIGVTVHNTEWISVASNTTPAEQYTRATVNGNMKDVRVHYYVDDTCAWQNLPLTLTGWHAADGSGNGNMRTIAIECIMSGNGSATDKKSEDNAARIAAELLKTYGLTIDNLYTHTHWLNVRDGYKGTTDYLNTLKRQNVKYCPAFILPHWAEFKAKVEAYMKDAADTNATNVTNVTDTAKHIWDKLRAAGLSEAGAAVLMGNLKAESNLIATNLQNTFESKLGFTDESYTDAVDSGTYTNFANDGAGYGLAQWTYHTRKAALLAFAKEQRKSVGDLDMQIEFVLRELLDNYPVLFGDLRTATTVRTASDSVLVQYERPADMSESVKIKRAGFGEEFLREFGGQDNVKPVEPVETPAHDTMQVTIQVNGKAYSGILTEIT
jgi:hypothetical protein